MNPRTLILVKTSPANHGQRDVCHQTWLSLKKPDQQIIFFSEEPSPDKNIIHLKQNTAGNLIENVVLWAYERFQFEYLFICKDDAYIRLDKFNLLEAYCDEQGGAIGEARFPLVMFSNAACRNTKVFSNLRPCAAISKEGGMPSASIVASIPGDHHRIVHRLREVKIIAEMEFCHNVWSGDVFFLKNGIFARSNEARFGKWEYDGDTLTLDWFDWGIERLRNERGIFQASFSTAILLNGQLPITVQRKMQKRVFDVKEHLIVYRFHENFNVVRERIANLAELNPGIQIHALYGGSIERLDAAKNAVEKYVERFYYPEFYRASTPQWMKWANPGLIGIRQWWEAEGKTTSARFFHLHESDILALGPFSEMYDGFADDLILSGNSVMFDGSDWARSYYSSNGQELMDWFRKQGLAEPPLRFHIFAGTVYPRKFLEDVSKAPMCIGISDEADTAFFAELFGYTIERIGNAFFGSWSFVNVEGDVLGQIKEGKKFFHSVKRSLKALEDEVRFRLPLETRRKAEIYWAQKWQESKKTGPEQDLPIVGAEKLQKAEHVTLVFTGDAGYLNKISYCLAGIFANTRASLRVIYVSNEIPDQYDLARVEAKILQNNAEFIFIQDPENFRGVSKSDYFAPCWHRLRLPWLLPEEDVIITMDPDVFVREDIAFLPSLILDNSAIAAAFDSGFYNGDDKLPALARHVKTGTINAGVMVMRLSWFRKNWQYSITRESARHTYEDLACPEQQFLQVTTWQNINYIDLQIVANNLNFRQRFFDSFGYQDRFAAFNAPFAHCLWSKPWRFINNLESHSYHWQRLMKRYLTEETLRPRKWAPLIKCTLPHAKIFVVFDSRRAHVARRNSIRELSAQNLAPEVRVFFLCGRGDFALEKAKDIIEVDCDDNDACATLRCKLLFNILQEKVPEADLFLADEDACVKFGAISILAGTQSLVSGRPGHMEGILSRYAPELGGGFFVPSKVLQDLKEAEIRKFTRPGWWICESSEDLGHSLTLSPEIYNYATIEQPGALSYFPESNKQTIAS
ncbi:MAG: hypothetical protein LBD01_06100 [Puniceicoccales bacterium]|jgi:lipopolysaccharide biosynthesis glycosyltransferase|nr:hypothetical protein [Puniceicoccales bacterium]